MKFSRTGKPEGSERQGSFRTAAAAEYNLRQKDPILKRQDPFFADPVRQSGFGSLRNRQIIIRQSPIPVAAFRPDRPMFPKDPAPRSELRPGKGVFLRVELRPEPD